MRGAFLLLSVLAMASCARSAPIEPELGSPFTLRTGQEVAIQGTPLRLRFLGVPEDSRCPIDVVCVWEGDAEVRLLLAGDALPETLVDLHTSTRAGARAVTVSGYRIDLQRVEPARWSDQTIPQERYHVTVLVSRAP